MHASRWFPFDLLHIFQVEAESMGRKACFPLLIILLLILSFLLYQILLPLEILTVHFMDVGQGDAILIQSPGFTAFIDGGQRFPWVQEQKVETIDILMATHAHAYHIGGLLAVLEHYSVGVSMIVASPLPLRPSWIISSWWRRRGSSFSLPDGEMSSQEEI